MENLELKYVISPNDSLSQQSLSASLKKLKTLLDSYKGLKIEIAGFATVTNQFKEVTSEAKKLHNELKAIKSMKVNIFGGSKNTDIAKQTSELKKLQKEITSSEAKMAKLNSELERSKSGRKLDAYKNSEINRLTNAKNKGDIGTQEYTELKRVIKSLNVDIAGKNVVVLGRSNIVGKPVAQLLLNENATVTICHSKTKNLRDVCRAADILVVAIGRPKFIDETYVNEDAIVIDVGTSSFEGKITGDVDFDKVIDKCKLLTPVPGGVGALTTTLLIKNACEALKDYEY